MNGPKLKFSMIFGLGAIACVLGCQPDEPGEQPCPNEAGVICPWVGTGSPGFDGDGNTLRESRLYWPVDVTFTSHGPYVVDWNNHRIRYVHDDETLETVIGTDFLGDGPDDLSDLEKPGAPGTSIHLNHPTQILEMAGGHLLMVSWHNHKLRVWDPDTGLAYVACGRGAGYDGDGPIEDALLNQPQAARYGPDGSLYVLDQRNQRIRRITSLEPGGMIETVVGTGELGFAGDGGSPLDAQVSFPPGSNPPPAGGLDFDEAGRLYFSDTLNNRIRRVDFDADLIDTVIGDGTTVALNNPRDVERGPDGRIYVADELNHRVLALDVDTLDLTVVAGTGKAGDSGDFGPAAQAELNRPSGIAFDGDGNLYISDTYNHRIRLVRGAK
jgi:sugar lactone lactonase YvrE